MSRHFERPFYDYRALWLANEHRAEPTPDGPLTAEVDDYQAARETYGMSRVVDPRAQLSDWDLSQFLIFKSYGYGVGYRDENTVRADKKAGKRAIMFDLRLPLAPQLEAARDYLQVMQDHRGGVQASPKNRVEN